MARKRNTTKIGLAKTLRGAGLSDDVITAALEYAHDHCWKVLPVAPNKAPLTEHGWQSASSDDRQIRRWWGWRPDANVAIACRPSNLLVLDVDVDERDSGDETLANLERTHGRIPDAPRARSGGGGFHVYVRNPGFATVGSLGAGIHVRDHHYIVAPPSVHQSGQLYHWEIRPDECPVPTLPAAWLELLTRTATPAAARQGDEWWLDAASVARVLPILGIIAPIGKNFQCVLPGHPNDSGRGASISKDTLDVSGLAHE